MTSSPVPKVSVCMCTFNHEKYIVQAMESVLSQQTNLTYELVIGEDCSTDGTREIVAEYQSRYPERIRATLYPANMGAYYNGTQTLLACRGQYIAILDGDDYWTSPDKLQKQVDYLDRYPECSLCFHKASIDRYGQVIEHHRKRITGSDAQFSFDDIILENFIDTTTVVFRSSILRHYPPKWLKKLAMGDWPLWILCAKEGKLGYLDENMATYRIHYGGMWSGQSAIRQAINTLYAVNVFKKEFHIRNRKFDDQLAKWRRHLIDLRLHQGDYFKAANDSWGLLPYAIAHSRPLSMFVLKTLLRGYLPPVWNALNRMKQVYGRVAAPSK